MGNLSILPFTELFERLQQDLMRDATGEEDKYKSMVNDIYCTWLPSQLDWRAIRTSSYITTVAEYTTGTVAVTNGSTTLTGTDTVWVTGMTDRKIKFDDDDEIYAFTYVSETSGTLGKNFLGTTATAATYTIFDDDYALASDFQRMLPYGNKRGLYYFDDGDRFYLEPRREDEFFDHKSDEPADPLYYWIDHKNTRVILDPPPDTARYLHYEYIPTLSNLTEYTTGTVAISNNSTALVGTDTDFTNNVATTDYIRLDDDGDKGGSVWYGVTTITDATHIVLSSVYAGANASAESYTSSKVPLLATGLHLAILYGAAIVGAADQESAQFQSWKGIYDGVVAPYIAMEKHERQGVQKFKTIWEKPGVFR